MSSNTTSPRRLLVIGSLVVALILSPFCIGADDVAEDKQKLFFAMASAEILASTIVLVAGRSRWRWLLLFSLLPCVYNFIRLISSLNQTGLAFPH